MDVTNSIKRLFFTICDQIPGFYKCIIILKNDGSFRYLTYSLSLKQKKYIEKSIEKRKRKHIKNTIGVVIEMGLEKTYSKKQIESIKIILKQYPFFNELKIYLLYNIDSIDPLLFFKDITDKNQAIGSLHYHLNSKADRIKILTEQMVSPLQDYSLNRLFENSQCNNFLLPLKIKNKIFNMWERNDDNTIKSKYANGSKQSRLKGSFLTMSDTDNNNEQIFQKNLFTDILPKIPKPNRIVFNIITIIILCLIYSLLLFWSYKINMNHVQEFFTEINTCMDKNENFTLEYYHVDTQFKQLKIKENNIEQNLDILSKAILKLKRSNFWWTPLVNIFLLDFSKKVETASKKLYCQQYEEVFLDNYNKESNKQLFKCKQNISQDYDWPIYCTPYIMASKYRIEILDSFIKKENKLIYDIDTWYEPWTTTLRSQKINMNKLYYFFVYWKNDSTH
ncbi:hypothetical protein MHK_002939, partial [Candidatus Magnetomorum sp. HK-1]